MDSDLAQFDGKELDGAMAILNIGSFNTFVGKVEEHGREGNITFKFKVLLNINIDRGYFTMILPF